MASSDCIILKLLEYKHLILPNKTCIIYLDLEPKVYLKVYVYFWFSLPTNGTIGPSVENNEICDTNKSLRIKNTASF